MVQSISALVAPAPLSRQGSIGVLLILLTLTCAIRLPLTKITRAVTSVAIIGITVINTALIHVAVMKFCSSELLR